MYRNTSTRNLARARWVAETFERLINRAEELIHQFQLLGGLPTLDQAYNSLKQALVLGPTDLDNRARLYYNLGTTSRRISGR
jgi:hypothetical protein